MVKQTQCKSCSEKKPILIIEDDFYIRSSLQELLESEGYAVRTAENGKIGIDKIRMKPRPCLVFLDLMMPIMDGKKFLEVVAGDETSSTIPVIVISAIADEKNTTGATSYIKKPVDVDRVLEFAQVFCH